MWFVCVGVVGQSVVYVNGSHLRWKLSKSWPTMALKSRSKFKSCAARRKDLKGKGKAKGTSDVGPIHRPVDSNPSSVLVVPASEAEDSAASFQGPSDVSDHQCVQPMWQAKLLRVPIVDSDIEHQLVFPKGSSSSSSNNNNSDSGSSSSPEDDDSQDDDVYVSGGSTVSAVGLDSSSSSHDSPEPQPQTKKYRRTAVHSQGERVLDVDATSWRSGDFGGSSFTSTRACRTRSMDKRPEASGKQDFENADHTERTSRAKADSRVKVEPYGHNAQIAVTPQQIAVTPQCAPAHLLDHHCPLPSLPRLLWRLPRLRWHLLQPWWSLSSRLARGLLQAAAAKQATHRKTILEAMRRHNVQDAQDAETAQHTTFCPLEAREKHTWRTPRTPRTPCKVTCCCSTALWVQCLVACRQAQTHMTQIPTF